MTGEGDVFVPWLARWRLTPDGDAIVSHAGRLLPVRDAGGAPAMLKISDEPEERRGARLMAWWAGEGAARVMALDGDALLLERAIGSGSLDAMALSGADDEATRIICEAAAALHAPRNVGLPPDLVPLDRWFSSLLRARDDNGGLLARCAETARRLLEEPRDIVVLHGDLHHGNILDFGPRGWLAIDPKGLVGERGFDFANLFCNPDRTTALAPGRLARQAEIVSQAARLERDRLLKWIAAWAALSAVWMVEDGDHAEPDVSIAATAFDVLGS